MKKLLFILAIILLSFTVQSAQYKVLTLNCEWLSCVDNGPTDEALQIRNIAAVIVATNADIAALQEVGTSDSYATVDTLVKLLGNEWAGNIVPWRKGNCNQSQGIVYKKSKVQLVSSSLISNGGSFYNWSGGRYPALYNVNLLTDGDAVPVSFVNIHAKAMGDETSYARRVGASEGLKTLLDGSPYNMKNVVLIGDFNDYLTGTQCRDCPSVSPYKNFMDDTQNWAGLTGNLQSPGYRSPTIDNIVISNELFANYVQNSVAQEFAAAATVADYHKTTTDHYPVSILLKFDDGGSGDCTPLNFSETFAESLGNFTPQSVAGSQNWYWQQSYGAYISGYAGGTNNENED